MKMPSLSTGGGSARLGGAFGEAWAFGGKIRIYALAAGEEKTAGNINPSCGMVLMKKRQKRKNHEEINRSENYQT